MLPLRVRVDLGAMAMNGYSTFPKSPSLAMRWFNVIYRTLVDKEGSYPSAEMQLVYSTVSTDWAKRILSYLSSKLYNFDIHNVSYLYNTKWFMPITTLYKEIPTTWELVGLIIKVGNWHSPSSIDCAYTILT